MCKWTEIEIKPRDVLFFRGGKPMGASAIGEGGGWPMPSVFHQAMLSAFHERWPDAKTKHRKNEHDKNQDSSFRFGDLQTVGVFPNVGNTVYFPMPADVQCKDKEGTELCILEPGELSGKSDLPAPLELGLFKPGEATKEKPSKWISEEDLQKYLQEDVRALRKAPQLFDIESRPGIGIDPETRSTEEGMFYIAETLRLREGVSLKGFARGEMVGNYFSNGRKSEFIFGGQRGVAFLDGVRDDTKQLPTLGKPSGTRIKWVLLTPAIFTGGWLPSWINSKGEILKFGIPEGESKKSWRKRSVEERKKKAVKTSLGKLVAACIPKPVPISGWKAQCGNEGPRPTRLCVPAGAVYYFETESKQAATQLLKFLNGKRKSDIAAEKGFGFGVCGTWQCTGDTHVAHVAHKGEEK